MSRWVTRSKLLWYALAALLLLMAFRGQAAVPRQQPPATAKKAAPAAQRAPTPQRKPAPAPRKMAPAKPAPQKLPPVATETKPSEADPAEVQAPAPAAGPALSREEKAFYYDLSMLLAGPHRLSGSRPNAAAAEYIAHQLKSLALDDIFFLDMPVWQTVTERCELIVEGELIPLWPVHPNISVPPVTPPEGISGALVYVGAGEAENYGDRSVEGKIVVLDYDSFDNWHRAFVLGAKAVIFLGNGSETPPSSKYSGVPKNQIRLYASTAELHGVDLRVDHDEAILKSKVVWRESQGRNIIARIRGTAPDFSPERIEPEAVVLSTHYDSFGVIPELAPGARGAANVAALLETAQKLKSKPPKRDVILLFLDNDARGNQGAREVYEALEMPEEKAASLTSEHQQELSHVSAMRDLLLKQGLGFAPGGLFQAPAALWLKRKLQDLAGQVSDDIKKELELLRFVTARQEKESGVTRKRREFLETTGLRWDEVRRALHEDKFGKFVVFKLAAARGKGADAQEAKQYQKIFVRLRHDALGIFDRRMAELRDSIAIDRQRNLLREAMASSGKKEWVVLHVEYNLSDGGPTWGVVVSDWNRLLFPFRPARTDGDAPGYYGPVLNAFNDSAKQLNLKRLDVKTFTDPDLGLSFAPGPFISAGNVAGEYGLYNVSIMTGYDRRLRDGHPADRLESLDWRSLREQGIEATALIEGLADSQSISLPRVFKAVVGSHYPTWEAGKAAGNYVGIQVSGSLKEDRPAAGAVLAVWPVSKDANPVGQWTDLTAASVAPGYDPILLTSVNENGNFSLVGVREDNEGKVMTLGTLFDTDGRVAAISTQETQSQELKNNMKINLIAAKSYGWSATKVDNSQWAVNLLSAASDATFQANRALFGQQGDEYFAYISDRDANYRIKIFQQIGPVALGDFKNKKAEYGAGLDPAGLTTWAHLSQGTARDIWTLNEKRFSVLRARGVTSADLEALHGRARRTLEQAKSENSASLREAALASSAMLSHKVYLPLRASMDDLVNAVILLLLLSIPFGFAMERLIICATSVYGRITGFTVMSLVTFALLYAMHPGFAIASTPMIILMAFAITMLSAMVIYILLRKFKTELRAIQGQSATVHDLEVSRMGTMLAAVEMGVSTMRRRPTRTTLTAITVVILTFTILAFASFSRTVGVRAAYEGPLGESMHAGILVRRLDYSQVSPGVLDAVKGQEGKGGFIAMHYWLPRKKDQGWRSTVARPSDGESLLTDALMGIPVEELSRWPELAAALGKGTPEEKQQRMREGGVFLPPIVQEVLRLQVGSPVLVNGKKVVFAGTFDPGAMQRLKALDGQSILPVDFQDPALMAKSQQSGLQGETRLLIAKQSDRHFVHLSSHQVILASSELVRELGGQIHLITIYPGEGVNVAQRGRQLAEILLLPVWAAGPDGIERLILTILTEVSGGLALLVPLLLGGLIIFGTLLGSISDREKEIYTFSALGLSPGHVGVLFFAEAAVYAVVGGMGGQLLAQGAAYGATSLARAGYIEPTSVNYSSTNSLFAIGVVMLTVLVSAIYPAYRASKSANPGLARAWKMPAAEGDLLKMTFPFTVSAYDITGVVSFLAEHFRRHDDAGLGGFAASNVEVRQTKDRNLELTSDLALAPFDLGVTEHLTLTAVPSQIEGVDEVAVKITRSSGAHGDWYRSTRVFMRDLRRQFLLWRTLSNEMIEHYRLQTLQVLGVLDSEAAGRTPTPKQN